MADKLTSFFTRSLELARDLAPFSLPVILTLAVVLLVDDPSERYPLLVFVLPLFLRSAAIVLGLYDPSGSGSKLNRVLNMFRFAAVVIGWTVILSIVSVAIAVNLLSFELTTTVMKRAILLSVSGFVMAAWLWWPNYAKSILADWPWHEVRIWVPSSNRWDVMFRSFRMRQMLQPSSTWWRGFCGVASLAVLIMALSALGVYQGTVVVLTEFLAATVLLPMLHLVIVRAAHNVCLTWDKEHSVAVTE